MVLTKFKPHSPFSWEHKIQLAKLKRQYREKRCKECHGVPPKILKERRQS